MKDEIKIKKQVSTLLPLTHTTYYTLLALVEPLHGYGIMQKVEEISKGEVKLGPGTLYGALGKLEKEKLIEKIADMDSDRRKSYVLTERGKELVLLEFNRLQNLLESSKELINQIGGEIND